MISKNKYKKRHPTSLTKTSIYKSVVVGVRLGVEFVEERDKSKLLGVKLEYTDVVSEQSVSDDE